MDVPVGRMDLDSVVAVGKGAEKTARKSPRTSALGTRPLPSPSLALLSCLFL